jgi:hypothetical protein
MFTRLLKRLAAWNSPARAPRTTPAARHRRPPLLLEALERRNLLDGSGTPPPLLTLVGNPYLVDARDAPLNPNAIPAGMPIYIHKNYQASDLPPFGHDGGTTYIIRNTVDTISYWHPGGWDWGVGIPGVTNWTEYWGGWQTEAGPHTASGKLDNFDNFASNDAASRSWQFPFTTLPRPVVTIATTDPLATEADQHAGVFTLTRAGNSNFAMTVTYTVAGSTAMAGTDYQSLSGSVAFAAGQTTATIRVVPLADADPEPREHVIVTLNGGALYTVGAGSGGSATVDIKDDAKVTVAATTPLATDAQHPGVFTVTREGDTIDALTVTYTVAGTAVAGTAGSGADYTRLSGSVQFAAGAATSTIDVTPIRPTPTQGGKTVVVTLSPGTAGGRDGYKVGEHDNDVVTLSRDPSLLPHVRIDLNGTEDKSDDITYIPSSFYDPSTNQPIRALITNTGPAGTIHLATNRAGAIGFSKNDFHLETGEDTVVIVSAGIVSASPNDTQILATSLGVPVGSQTMTVVQVVIPDHVRAADTPPEMQQDRIPPRAGNHFQVRVTPDLRGSGQYVTLDVAKNGGANGTVELNGDPESRLTHDTDVVLRSPDGGTQTAPGSGGNLRLEARVRGQAVIQSKGFSVAAIPLKFKDTFLGSVNTDIDLGLLVQDSWISDSGAVADLDQVQLREQVQEAPGATGTLRGLPLHTSGWF